MDERAIDFTTEDGARLALARAGPALERAAALVVAAAGGRDTAAALVQRVEADFLAKGRAHVPQDARFEPWLAATLARYALPASQGCATARDLALEAQGAAPHPHVVACRSCSLALGAARAALAAPQTSAASAVAPTQAALAPTQASPAPKPPTLAPTKTSARQLNAQRAASSRRTRATPTANDPDARSGSKLWIGAVALGAIVVAIVALRPRAPAPTSIDDVAHADPTSETKPKPTKSPAPTTSSSSPAPTPTPSASPPLAPPTPPPPPPPDAVPPPPPDPVPPPPPDAVPTPAPAPTPTPDAPPPPPPPATTSAPPPPPPATTAKPVKIGTVRGEITLTLPEGSRQTVTPGPLELPPGATLTGHGSLELDDATFINLDAATLHLRFEDGKGTVVTVDSGTISTQSSKTTEITLELPQGTVKPDGRIAVNAAPKESWLVVLEGHASLTPRTQSKPTDVVAGERATMTPQTVSKRKAKPQELDRAREKIRWPLFTIVPEAPKPKPYDHYIEPGSRGGSLVAAKGAGSTHERVLESEPWLDWQHVKVHLDPSARVAMRGTLQFRYHGPASPLRLVQTLTGTRQDRTAAVVLPRASDEWQTLWVPLSIQARKHDGGGDPWNSFGCIRFESRRTFQVDEISFSTDAGNERPDGLREEVLVSLRGDKAPKDGVVESVVGKTVTPFVLKSGRWVATRCFGPEGNGAFQAEPGGAVELAPKTRLHLARPPEDEGFLVVRASLAADGASGSEVLSIELVGTPWNAHAVAFDKGAAQCDNSPQLCPGQWMHLDLSVIGVANAPLEADLAAIRFTGAIPKERPGIQVDNIEIVRYRR